MQYALKSFLERLGLSGNEMKIYAAALEHGESTPTELASRARVHRVAAYPIIESLVSKGLLTQTDAKHRKRVSPTHPKQLHALLKDRKRTLRKLELAYEDILPDLEALYRQSPARPRVQFYQGVKGLEQVNADIIETLRQLPEEERETLSYSNPNVVDERFDDYILGENGYVDLRKRYKIRNKAIGLDGPVTQDIVTRDKEELRETIVLPEELFPFRNDITIYGNKIALQALQNEFIGVIIESEELVRDQRAVFTLAWAGATQLAQDAN